MGSGMHITIRQLFTVDAIVRNGSIKAAADALHRTHPSVMAAIKKLEEELGFDVFDRSGYRAVLTRRGGEFYKAAQPVLEQYVHLSNKVRVLKTGADQQLNIVVGDVTPPSLLVDILRQFSAAYPEIQLNLYSGNIMGPQERLYDDAADVMIHHVDRYDTGVEVIGLGSVAVEPVAAPGYLAFPVGGDTTYEQLKDYVQCIIRCTADHTPTRDYFLLDGYPSITVDDQLMKKRLILSGMAWGHLPDYLIRDELRDGRLVSLAGRNIKKNTLEIVAARRVGATHGPTARLFWEFLRQLDIPAPGGRSIVDLVTRKVQGHELT